MGGYPGELIVEGNLGVRWLFWLLALIPFAYIVQTLLVGLAEATAAEANEQVRALVFRAQWVTVVSWLTYPVDYLPNDRLQGSSCGGGHSGRILCLRHHLQVWCWAHHLQHHFCQVPVGEGGCFVVLRDACGLYCEVFCRHRHFSGSWCRFVRGSTWCLL